MTDAVDTIAAVATPPGEGGIAIVRISGPGVPGIVARMFLPARSRQADGYAGYTVRYGRFSDPNTGDVVDDGLVTLFRRPRSYTGEDTAELSCHGGRAVTARVLACVLAAGARPAEPGEFTRRAFANGRLDLAQAEAVADLIRSRTDASRRLARRQLEGGLSRRIGTLRDALIGVLAAIEVTIDFSEEVGELDHGEIAGRLAAVRDEVRALIAQAQVGRILRDGLRLAIVGRPNAGKSSLMNRLLRTERSIVTPIPGTTRDLVEESCSIGGIPVTLVDTAGLHESGDPVERIGMARAREALELVDAALLVVDVSMGMGPADMVAVRSIEAAGVPRVVVAVNKCDLVAPSTAREITDRAPHALDLRGGMALAVSAVTGEGLDALEAAIARPASEAQGLEDGQESIVVSSARHCEALNGAKASLDEALATAVAGMPGDFIAIDTRAALDALGLITGETVTDDIINRIFHDFCVGK